MFKSRTYLWSCFDGTGNIHTKRNNRAMISGNQFLMKKCPVFISTAVEIVEQMLAEEKNTEK